jgi:plastocyanin
VPELSLGSRFVPLQGPTGIPTLGLRVGAWSGAGLGLSYSSSGAYLGNPHEIEFSLKQRLFSEERGAPVSASLLGAVNTGAYSIDGELALSRNLGPLTLLGTARLLGNADGARLPLGGFGAGARLGILPQLALVGDVFKVVNDASALPAWGAGVQLQLPASPYAVTLHVANTPSSSRQGASLGGSDLRVGVDMAMVLPGWQPGRVGGSPAASRLKPQAEPKPASEAKPLPVTPVRVAQAPEAAAPASPPPRATPKAEPASIKAPPAPALTPLPSSSEPAKMVGPAETVKPRPKAPAKPTAKPVPKPIPKPSKQAPAKASVRKAPSAKPAVAPERSHESELWIVMIRDGQPSPLQVQLRRGSSVTWFNRDATAHALVGSGWESGPLAAGTQFTRRFEKPGTFRYHCRLHPQETGTVTVR